MQDIYEKVSALREEQAKIIYNSQASLEEIRVAAAKATAYFNVLTILHEERMKQLELRGVQALNNP